ncbi:hypothetical protein P3L10_022064 [Capsicum annuum]
MGLFVASRHVITATISEALSLAAQQIYECCFLDPQQWQENYDFRPGLTDKPGLHVRDFLHGHWVLVDGDLGPQEAIVYPGLATAGYISPALHRTDIGNQQGSMYGRCSLSFKLMPKSMTNLNCSEMRAAGHGVEAQFQLPVPVDDFMQRSTDQLLNRNNFPTFNFPTAQEGPWIDEMLIQDL